MRQVTNQLKYAAMTLMCLLLLGCQQPESTFEIAKQSRLPKWFTIPDGLTRSDVTVTMTYYIKSSGRTAKFTLLDRERHTIAEMNGSVKGLEPVQLKNAAASSSGYPSYEIITVNGITEVIEHRRMEPVFYITDDASVLNELGVHERDKLGP